MILTAAVIIASLFSLVGGWIAVQRSRLPEEGVLLGFFLGPVGILVEALLPGR